MKSKPFDYYESIVLDISMPIMDGIEACTLIVAHLRQAVNMQEEVKGEEQPIERKAPYLYALTSEIDTEIIIRMHHAGFKAICK